MDVQKVLYMVGGSGETSYAANSKIQVEVTFVSI